MPQAFGVSSDAVRSGSGMFARRQEVPPTIAKTG